MENFMNGMFGPVRSDMCRLTMNGGIAIYTGGGYRTYDPGSKAFINCDSFVFDVGDEMFFIIPTNKVKAGDIILAGGEPRYVLSVEPDTLTVINYKSGTVENLLPERHIFMGKAYFYGKIVSMFGDMKKTGGIKNIMKYMMMAKMMKGIGGKADNSGMNAFMMMAMMGGGGNIFDGMFSFADDDDTEKEED
ncbi:MAG: hypothetical protein K6G68_03715 [Oscillospiraceae bacterium]|nr:hypothetical protein [Oscillospiraceae bacterium]